MTVTHNLSWESDSDINKIVKNQLNKLIKVDVVEDYNGIVAVDDNNRFEHFVTISKNKKLKHILFTLDISVSVYSTIKQEKTRHYIKNGKSEQAEMVMVFSKPSFEFFLNALSE